jgi:hypothetical protein
MNDLVVRVILQVQKIQVPHLITSYQREGNRQKKRTTEK